MVQRYIILFFVFTLSFISCESDKTPKNVDLSSYVLADSLLQLSCIASEPMIVAPVALDFDEKGRIWVAEMPDYMPDINGEKEQIPAGRIVILEDTDNDGVMDKSITFKDKIPQLRALKLFNNGILYADDPILYFSEIVNDGPGKTIVIDSSYAIAGNVEHKANGLLLNVDHCFYNAKSNFRYCFEDGSWSKEVSNFRGQWGITNDENGRLITNDNSNFLFGDQFLPNTIISNQYLHKPEGLNKDLIKDRSLFPIHATSINRGYNEGVLDESGKVKKTTSACGPLLFQSEALGNDYLQDAFVCAPEANLIKRLKIQSNEFFPQASFAYPDKEFLTSSDEAFRPVNLYTGYDGNLYIVDMHRGIIQHKIYMTNYLKESIENKGLDKIINYGRILKISKKEAPKSPIKYDFSNEDSLILYLAEENAWLRSKAQEKLRFLDSKTVDDKLYKLLSGGSKVEKIHALWILDVRNKLDFKKLDNISFQDEWVIANMFTILGKEKTDLDQDIIISTYQKYISHKNPIVVNHMLTSLSKLYDIAPAIHKKFLAALESGMIDAKIAAYPSGTVLNDTSSRVVSYNEKVENNEPYYIYRKEHRSSQSEDGYTLFNKYCSPCHGFGGEGLEGQAPSLVGSTLINNRPEMIPLIIKHGLTGPVTINGVKENFSSVMPSFNISTSEIEKISNYIYNAFSNEVKSVNKELIEKLDKRFSDRKEMWTEEELLNTDFASKR